MTARQRTPALRRGALLLVLALGSSGCPRSPSPSPPDAATQPRALTEADTSALPDGRLESADGGWSLTLPAGTWRLVSDEARTRLQASADRWALEPAAMAHVTVSCAPERTKTAADLQGALTERARALGRPLRVEHVTAIEGPWLRGAVALFETTEGGTARRHALAAYDLGRTGCEVQAWQGVTDGGNSVVLDALVKGFSPKEGRALRLASRLGSFVRRNPALEAQVATALDAGVQPGLELAAVVARGLPRLPSRALEERFALRRGLLSRLDDARCAQLVMQERTGDIAWLELLTDEEADRWGRLSEEALTAALGPGTRVGPEAAARAEKALVKESPDVAGALEVLKQVDRVPPGTVCAAERARLDAALKLNEEERLVLYRVWVGGLR